MVARLEASVREAIPSSMDQDPEEAGWVARARLGEEAAYRWLLSRYRDRAVRLASHVLRRPQDAEDVAQEAFIRAFRNLHQFRGEGRFYTWLYHIVVRICLDRRRMAWWRSEVPLEPDCAGPMPPRQESDSRMMVEALLDRLAPAMRAALILRELEGLEYEEIAAVLRIPVGTVRSRLHSARAQFRALWEAANRETDHV